MAVARNLKLRMPYKVVDLSSANGFLRNQKVAVLKDVIRAAMLSSGTLCPQSLRNRVPQLEIQSAPAGENPDTDMDAAIANFAAAADDMSGMVT